MKRNGTKRQWNEVFGRRILMCSEVAVHSPERSEQQLDADRATSDDPAGDGYPGAVKDSSTLFARVDTLQVASVSMESLGRYMAYKDALLARKQDRFVVSTPSIRVCDLFEGRSAQTLH